MKLLLQLSAVFQRQAFYNKFLFQTQTLNDKQHSGKFCCFSSEAASNSQRDKIILVALTCHNGANDEEDAEEDVAR